MHVSGPLTLVTRNLDKGFVHSIVVTAQLTEIALPRAAPVPALTLLDLGA
jgi:hypothetical protein